MKHELNIQDIVNSIYEHNSNPGAILNTNKELLLLIENEIDQSKQLTKVYKGKLTTSELEVLKIRFDNLYKQVSDILTNIGVYRNELALRDKMDAYESQPEWPITNKQQFNKDFDKAFDFSSEPNPDMINNVEVTDTEANAKPK
jgi:hypothetical protein